MRTTVFFAVLTLCALWTAASVKWLEKAHDFGTIAEADGKTSCVMRLVNTADTAISITSVRATCGCTTVEYPRGPIWGGDTAAIRITYNPAGLPGEFDRDVAVRLSSEPERVLLNITGKVVASESTVSRLYPLMTGQLGLKTSVLAFGKRKKGTQKTVYLHGYNAGPVPVVVGIDDVAAPLKVAALSDTVPAGSTCTIAVTIDTDKCRDSWGPTEYSFRVLAQPAVRGEGALAGVARVTAVVNLEDDFSTLTPKELAAAPVVALSYDKIDFGPLGSTAESRKLTIYNKGKSTLVIHRIASDTPQSVSSAPSTMQIAPGSSAAVTITATLPGDDGKESGDYLNARLTIYCNDPQNPTPSCRLVGTKK